MTNAKVQSLSSFAWSIAEILRGDFKQSEYGKVVLPFVVLRRLDCILESSKDAVVAAFDRLPNGIDDQTKDMMLFGAVGGGLKVYNYNKMTFAKIRNQDPGDVHKNLLDYVTSFNTSVRDIFLEKFLFTDQLKRLKDGGILWQVFDRFCQIDLHPDTVSNIEMGYLFEDLIRRFSEISNETAGEHFTPREVIRLIVDLLLINDADALAGSGIIRTVYDPACGTGGMLALMEEAMKGFNDKIRVELYGQELNPESFGICKSDMLVTGHNPEQIAFGNTLTEDAHKDKKFHYMLSNALTPTFTRKRGNKIYRYYVNIKAIKQGRDSCDIKTFPADEIENFVLAKIREMIVSPELLNKVYQEAKLKDGTITLDYIRDSLQDFNSVCQTPEQFKAWSQNLGHDGVMTTFTSYGSLSTQRQGELIKNL